MIGRPVRKVPLRLWAAVLSALMLLASAGCSCFRRGEIPPPEAARASAADNAAVAAPGAMPPAVPLVDEPAVAHPAGPPAVAPVPSAVPAEKPREEGPAPAAPPESSPARKSRAAAAPEPAAPHVGTAAPPPAAVAPPRPETTPPPAWTQQREALSYRVDFLGITMGYARFLYKGKASIGGKTAYHINVRAWTSGVLSYIYPLNDTIDYYLDQETIAPIRIEYTGRKKKRDDAAVYDQENGKIVYRYMDNGEVRKRVDVVPSIHDPVSAVYFFRWKDMGREDKAKNVYGGRKVYQIATRQARSERLRTARGEIDTLVIEPVIRRDGKVENKGDLRMWVTNDEMRLPVRVYGKFRKIREWTLVGELMPERSGG